MAGRDWTRRGALAAATGAAAACAQSIETPAYSGTIAFEHGVASGDPTHDRMIIWTRVTASGAGPVPVRWIVARDRELTDIVKTGVVETGSARDFTVKADVTGLRAGAPYFYGFRAGEAQSPVGAARTLPRGRVDEARIAVASCASYPHGFFNAYAALAQRDDIDLVLHLGDYIYEYGLSGYGGEVGARLGRVPSPEVECTRLEDYRARHAQYKRQPELQAAHALTSWIVVWDDHEVANDSFSTGAENHQPNEGDWAARKRAALQAYYEWMPIREPEPGRAFEAINRAFQYGDLFTLIMLETRLLARTPPLDYAQTLPIEMQRWNFADPSAPIALRDTEADAPAMQRLPRIYEAVGSEVSPVLDWRRASGLIAQARNLPPGFFVAPDVAAIDALLSSPERAMLGEAQESWLGAELARSTRSRTVWQVLGNQVLMAPLDAPDVSAAPAPLVAALERLRPGVGQLLKLTRFAFPINPDAWDGYRASRERLLQSVRSAGANAIVLTGDTRAAWANEIADNQGRAAVEFGATSITSPSDGSYFSAAGMDFAGLVRARNPHVKYTEQLKHGFLLLSLNRERALAEFFSVSTILSDRYEVAREAAFSVAPGAAIGALQAAE